MEKEILLISIAVGKYSNEYWNEYNVNKTRASVSPIVRYDIEGAVAGIRRSAPRIFVCACLGYAPGALIEAGRGALGGAVSGSAIGAVMDGLWQLM